MKDAHPWAGCAPLGTVRGAPSSRRFEGWVRPGCCRGCCHGWLHPAGGGHALLPAHAGVKGAHPWVHGFRWVHTPGYCHGWVHPWVLSWVGAPLGTATDGCSPGYCHGWLHPAGGGWLVFPAHAGVKGAHPWVLVAGQAGGAAPPRPSTFVPPLQVQALGERRAGGPPLSLSFSFLSLHPPFCLTISTATTALCAGCRRSPPSSSRRWTTWCRR